MTNEELIVRIHALEAFAIDHLKNRRDRTFGQFWADFDAFDPELHARLQAGEIDDDVRSALTPWLTQPTVSVRDSHIQTAPSPMGFRLKAKRQGGSRGEIDGIFRP